MDFLIKRIDVANLTDATYNLNIKKSERMVF